MEAILRRKLPLRHVWDNRRAMTDNPAPTVALIDDDRNIITSLAIALQGEGFITRLYTDPKRHSSR